MNIIVNRISTAVLLLTVATTITGCSTDPTGLNDPRVAATSEKVCKYGAAKAAALYTNELDQQLFAAGFLGGFIAGLIEGDFRPTLSIDSYPAVRNEGRLYGYQESTTGKSTSALKSITLEDFGYSYITTKGIIEFDSHRRALSPNNSSETWFVIPNLEFCNISQCLLPDGSFTTTTIVAHVELSGYVSPLFSTNWLMSDYPRDFAVKQVRSFEKINSPNNRVQAIGAKARLQPDP